MPLKIKQLTTVFMLSLALTACSGGSTSSGLGLGVGGTWFGSLSRSNTVIATFTLSLSQVADDPEDPFSSNTLSGVFNSTDTCIGGGQVNGTLGANGINISVNSSNGELNLSGTASNTAMRGTWSNAGEITISTETIVTDTTETVNQNPGEGENSDGSTTTTTTTPNVVTTTDTISCNFGGTWSASR